MVDADIAINGGIQRCTFHNVLNRIPMMKMTKSPSGAQTATNQAVHDESTSLHDAFGAVMHGIDEIPVDLPAPDVAAAHDEGEAWLARRWS